MPSGPVVAAPATDPPPSSTANVTLVPRMGAPVWSSTITAGASGTAAPTVALEEVDETALTVVGTAGSVAASHPGWMSARRVRPRR